MKTKEIKTTINNKLIRSFSPCYDPEKFLGEDENLTIKEGIEKYRGIVPAKDIIWLLCRKEFMPDRDLRLFAVWCAREALKLVDNPDPRSVVACDVAERYANGEATEEELAAAVDDADSVAAAAAAVDDAAAAAAVDAAAWAAADSVAAAAAAADAAWAAADAAWAAAAAVAAAAAAAADAARAASREKQLEKLLTYFPMR